MTDRTPLVLVPGLLCDAALWRHQIDHLAELADVTVADVTACDSMAAMAEAVLAQAPPGPFALAGLSMGGYIALEIMRRAPERVQRLALLDTSARLDTPEQRERRLSLIAQCGRGDFQGVTNRHLPLFIHPDRLKDERLTGEIMAMTKRVGRDAYLRCQQAIMSSAGQPAAARRDREANPCAGWPTGHFDAARGPRGARGPHPAHQARGCGELRPPLDHGAARGGHGRDALLAAGLSGVSAGCLQACRAAALIIKEAVCRTRTAE